MARVSYPKGKSPVGIANFPHLRTADDKFDKKVFKVNLEVSASAASDLVGRVDNMIEAIKAGDPKVLDLMMPEEAKRVSASVKAKKVKVSDLPYGPKMDKEGNADESTVVFKFKKNGEFKDSKTGELKDARPPQAFNADGSEFVGDDIGGGSEIVVAFEMRPWCNAKSEVGVKLAMVAVQVKKLRTFGSGSASDFGFDLEESAASEFGETAGADGDPNSAEDF